jgi:hypothetical protein
MPPPPDSVAVLIPLIPGYELLHLAAANETASAIGAPNTGQAAFIARVHLVSPVAYLTA